MTTARTELQLYESLVVFTEAKTIVEIGVAYGDATFHLCQGAKKTGGQVYGYDLWDRHGVAGQFQKFSSRDEVAHALVGDKLTNFNLRQVNTRSPRFAEMLDRDLDGRLIDLALIDGDHSYEGLRNDLCHVIPRLSPTGLIILHDTLRIDGCREIVHDLRTKWNNGTFDIVDFPFGGGARRMGLTLVAFRAYPNTDYPIDELCGSPSRPHEIEMAELDVLHHQQQTTAKGWLTDMLTPRTMHTDRLGSIQRKKFEEGSYEK